MTNSRWTAIYLSAAGFSLAVLAWSGYAYLVLGLFTMFAPVLWLVMSSFKTESAIAQFPPTFLPYAQKSVAVTGHENPCPCSW